MRIEASTTPVEATAEFKRHWQEVLFADGTPGYQLRYKAEHKIPAYSYLFKNGQASHLLMGLKQEKACYRTYLQGGAIIATTEAYDFISIRANYIQYKIGLPVLFGD